jgi:hypothetical protein
MSFENRRGVFLRSTVSCANWASMSRSPRFRSPWCRGRVGHCRSGRVSFAIWKRLHRLISLSFRRLPFGSFAFLVLGHRRRQLLWLARRIFEALPGNASRVAFVSERADRFGKMSVRFIDVSWESDVSQDVVYPKNGSWPRDDSNLKRRSARSPSIFTLSSSQEIRPTTDETAFEMSRWGNGAR